MTMHTYTPAALPSLVEAVRQYKAVFMLYHCEPTTPHELAMSVARAEMFMCLAAVEVETAKEQGE